MKCASTLAQRAAIRVIKQFVHKRLADHRSSGLKESGDILRPTINQPTVVRSYETITILSTSLSLSLMCSVQLDLICLKVANFPSDIAYYWGLSTPTVQRQHCTSLEVQILCYRHNKQFSKSDQYHDLVSISAAELRKVC